METLKSKAAWIAGFLDGEGHVFFKHGFPSQARKIHRGVYVGNTDRHLIDTFRQFCADLGIHTQNVSITPRKPPRRTFYVTGVHRIAALRRLFAVCPLQCKQKALTARGMIEWFDRPRHSERFARMHEQALRTLYPAHTIRCIVRQLGYKQGYHSIVRRALMHLRLLHPRLHQGVACRCQRQRSAA